MVRLRGFKRYFLEVEKMESYKKEFIDFMVESKVLKFGEFTLKSGRKSPFFMNAGGYVDRKSVV